MASDAYSRALASHIQRFFSSSPEQQRWQVGPMPALAPSFHILVYPPSKFRPHWKYFTCGMAREQSLTECFIVAKEPHDSLVELLTVVAHYHLSSAALSVGHIVNFGRPWLEGSSCNHGLLSLPYLDGPAFERFLFDDKVYQCLWLIPITDQERRTAITMGLGELEDAFEKQGVDYADPLRHSVA